MAVKQEDIDLNKILDKAAGKKTSEAKKAPKVEPELASILDAAATGALKKKEGGEPSGDLPKDVSAGVSPGTTSTIPTTKWEDNPLNPVKSASDFENARDKTPEILFKAGDTEKLNSLLTKYRVPPSPTTQQTGRLSPLTPKPAMQVEYENASNLETSIKDQIKYLKEGRLEKREPKSNAEKDLENELVEVQNLKRKAATELAINGDKEVVVNRRTNEIGNSFNQFMNDIIKLNPPVKGTPVKTMKETEDQLMKMPTQFMTGVNMLKLTEPVEYERVTEAIAKGLPVSASQVAKITALGLNIEEAKLKRDMLKSPVTTAEKAKFEEVSKYLETIKPAIDTYEKMIKDKETLSKPQIADYQQKIDEYNKTVKQFKPLIEKVNAVEGDFAKRANNLLDVRRKNLIDNPEVLRSFIADGVATKLDELGKIKQGTAGSSQKMMSDFMLGHTWNYSPEQIKWASEQYLKEQGINPNLPQAQAAIKFLQENEGVMIGENSIAKAGGFRELGEGLIEPIVGTAKTFKDWARPSNDTYVESQSQGNVDVANKRLASEDTGVRGVMNDVLKGTGQFATQAALMYATSAGIGAIAEGMLGKSGVQLLADAKAANINPSFAFDDATANLAAGKFLTNIKDPLAVFTTSYAMSYDGNLKAALSYTSDNALAKRAAFFNASMDGATELFLSPLGIARGIIHKFSKNQTKDLLKILSDKSLKNDPSALKEYVGKFARGVLGTAKVSGAEIGEEMVTQISDYVTNMYLNPESDSFKNRNLRQELMTTAYQTGLSMALPALLNGIGAAKANSFSKGSLLISAQNRQAMIDDLNKDLALNKITQQQANQQIQLINTAAEVNADVPRKANGVQMDTNEKANYVWSRVTEAYMDKKLASTTDKAQEEIWRNKIKDQQEYRKQILGLTEAEPEVPLYTIDDKPVDRKEFLETAEAAPDEHSYVVSGDEEAQQVIRQIGGIDDESEVAEPENKAIPTDEELVNAIEAKNIPGYTKTDISELKEQALQAPVSFKNQFGDDEATTISLIAKNSTDKINQAIEYQQERLKEPDIDENDIEEIDNHIKLLEQGLKQREGFFPEESIKEEEGKPLSKLEQLKAKRLLSKQDVPGETIDQKLKHISEQPENFGNDLVALAEKRFPKETTPTEVKGNQVLTKEAQDLLASIGEGSKPTFITKNLEKIAKDNGIEVTNKMSADDVINALKEKQSKPTDVVGSEGKILKPTDTGRDIAGNYLHNVHRYTTKQLAKLLDESREYVKNNPNDKFVPEINRRIAELEKGVEKDLKLQEIATQRGRSFTDTGKWVDDSYVDAPAENQLGTVTTSSNLWDIVFDSDGKMKPYTAAETLYFNPGGEGQIARSRMQHPDKQGGAVNLIFDRQSLAKDGIEVDKTGGEATISQEVPLTHLFPEAKIKAKDAILNEAEFRGIELSKEQLVHIDKVLGIEKPPPSSKSKPDSKPPNKPSENKPIEGVDEFGVPIGENVPPEVKGEPEQITQPIELSVEPSGEVKPLTKEAEDLLASIGEGSKPTFITKNLERIAKENGIEVTDKMSADDVINALKGKQNNPIDVVVNDWKAKLKKRGIEYNPKESIVDYAVSKGYEPKEYDKLSDVEKQKIVDEFNNQQSENKPIVNEPKPVKVAPKPKQEKPLTDEQAIEKWAKDEFGDDYISIDWDGKIAEIFQDRNKAPLEFTKEELIAKGVEFPQSKTDTDTKEEAELEKLPEPKIKDVNLNKEIDLLSADFLDINKPDLTVSSQRIKIIDVPISSISTDTSSFQNRETEFSQESVDKILKAVQEDNFNWTEFDPVTLWKNDNNLFMLSGHSRLEAFKRLTTMGYAGFDTIPSEIFEGTKEDAIAIALRSNTLSTKETPIERAGYYRDARLKGVASRSILNEAKDYEGRNALTIIALSYLNPKGKAIADLKALGQEGDTKSKANSLQMARWVGEVRQQFPQVTDAHENEIYDWLKAGAYAKIKNLAEISSRINNVVSGFDFDAEKPLNLEHRATKSYVDETYEQQLSDKEKQIKEQQKLISDKATKYNEAKLTPQEVAEKLVPDNAILARMQQDYIKLKDKKGAISEANKGILSLFDNIQTEIDNGTITEQQAESFINTTDEIEESDPIIEDIERNAESEITASQAIEEGIELINGENVIKNREVKAEKKLAEKVSVLEKEKTARINEITKPELNMNTLLINDLFTMAATNEANRQEYEDIKSQFFSLKNLFDCLFA